MSPEWLSAVGFAKLVPLASWDKQEEEWGIEGEGVALTVFPDEQDPTDRWFVRPRLGGGGVAIPPPADEGEVLLLMAALKIPTPLTQQAVDRLAAARWVVDGVLP